jgi:hypothetical protein
MNNDLNEIENGVGFIRPALVVVILLLGIIAYNTW